MTYRAHRVSRLQPSICLDSSVSWVMEFLINMFFTNLFQNLISMGTFVSISLCFDGIIQSKILFYFP